MKQQLSSTGWPMALFSQSVSAGAVASNGKKGPQGSATFAGTFCISGGLDFAPPSRPRASGSIFSLSLRSLSSLSSLLSSLSYLSSLLPRKGREEKKKGKRRREGGDEGTRRRGGKRKKIMGRRKAERKGIGGRGKEEDGKRI